jgi:hypothetical protein
MAIQKKSGYQNRQSKKEKDLAQRKFESKLIPEYIANIPNVEIEKINHDLIHHRGDYVRNGQLASKANDIRKAEATKKRAAIREKYLINDDSKTRKLKIEAIAYNENVSISTASRWFKD